MHLEKLCMPPLQSQSDVYEHTLAPSPRTREALLLIGIDPNEAGITKGMIGTYYRREMREWHPDKLEAILRNKTQQLANAKEHLDKVYP